MRKLIGIVCAFAMCGIALGQNDSDASGFSMRLGIYLPTDDDVQDITDNVWNLGIEYTLEKPLFGNSGETFLAADFLFDDFDGWAFSVNHRSFTGMSPFGGADNQMYFYLGGALLMLDDADDDSVFGVRLGLGFEFGTSTVAELGLFLAEDVDGVNPSGVQASIGFRFP